jgi:N-sulfoglucosamine sulfohydrolase
MTGRSETTRRDFMRAMGALSVSVAVAPGCAGVFRKSLSRPNVLLITADDLNCDSVGAYGRRIPGTTPNIDRLAAQGILFTHAHVTIAVCQPCRGVLATGQYPHRSGIEGFQHLEKELPTLMDILMNAGYLNGILGKVKHSTPDLRFPWVMQHDMAELGQGRDPEQYYRFSKAFFDRAAASGRPFFLMANSHDPHRPFSGSGQEIKKWTDEGIVAPSRSFAGREVEVPGFLPDIPGVRKELAEYYSSVRRCDDTVGAVLRALSESGQEHGTLVMFLSDHGMSFPFAKTNCYLHSTRTPWIVRWPGIIRPGQADTRHFISGVDFMPTVLDAVRLPEPGGMDGFSFLPLLKGGRQTHRDHVFTQFHETSAKRRYPMRCVQNERYGYIFNAWADGTREFRNESRNGQAFKAMQKAAETDPAIAERVKMFIYRAMEEFYDFEKDPDALHNLIGHPGYQDVIDQMREKIAGWMKRTGDPALEAFLNRNSRETVQRFMADQQAKADLGKKKTKKGAENE